MPFILVNAVQELDTRTQQQQNEIDGLKQEIAELEEAGEEIGGPFM